MPNWSNFLNAITAHTLKRLPAEKIDTLQENHGFFYIRMPQTQFVGTQWFNTAGSKYH